ncbi:MAG TPA: sigma-70 family RNA polymerase sigma factor [Bryobacteraceae bacterium]|nr:sigma-70 family RNA polymerase sigma factor [Bryobacteraceae bacterium]
MEESDSVAVARAKAGDEDAYRVLVERHSRSVFRLAYRMTGNEQDSEDVVQETFLRAYKQLHRWEARSSFSTWLYRIAANYSLDLVRRRQRHGEVGMTENAGESETDLVRALPSAEPGPDRLLFSDRVQQRVAETLDALSRQERTAFVLRHFEGQSIEEIAAALGLSGNAAKHSIFRAVQKLRRALEPLVNVQP